jgi:hypothetical protein
MFWTSAAAQDDMWNEAFAQGVAQGAASALSFAERSKPNVKSVACQTDASTNAPQMYSNPHGDPISRDDVIVAGHLMLSTWVLLQQWKAF